MQKPTEKLLKALLPFSPSYSNGEVQKCDIIVVNTLSTHYHACQNFSAVQFNDKFIIEVSRQLECPLLYREYSNAIS